MKLRINQLIFLFSIFFLTFIFDLASGKTREQVFYLYLVITRDDVVVLKTFEVIEGVPTDFPSVPLKLNYTILMVSTQNKTLFKAQIPVSFEAYPFTPEGEKIVELNESDQHLRLPYFENTSRIEIYHDEKLIFTFNLCNFNKLCERRKGENELNCKEDCLPSPSSPYIPTFYYFLIVFVVVSIVVFFLTKRIKVERSEITS